MNSALDDTKCLILASGTRIKLEKNLKFIFEVDDLD